MALTIGQKRCITTLDQPLVVAAGAGSGKTFTLTKRIVGALEDGHVSDIDEVCAITYTKKAAGELKSRIKSELRACGLDDQALKVDEAWVSTIHGMCARILRAHAVELGIDPAFSIADDVDIERYLSLSVDAVLSMARNGELPASAVGQDAGDDGALAGHVSQQALDALFAEYPARSAGPYGESVESMVNDLVSMVSSQAHGADAFVLPSMLTPPALLVERAVGLVEQFLDAAANERQNKSRDAWMADMGECVAAARASMESGIADYAETYRLVRPLKLSKQFGSKEFKAAVEDARMELAGCIMEAYLSAAQPHLEALIGLARYALELFAQMKREDGVLDNNDLLVMAANAIEDHPDIAARYADKFKLVMVDEFQDTDQMQVDMIKRIAGEGACRLCTVGDAQQSIYRFRGADVSVYRKHLRSIEADWEDGVIELSDNFRSHHDVLAFVDCAFRQPSMFGGEFMSLRAARDEDGVPDPFEGGVPRIIVQHLVKEGSGIGPDRAVARQAQRLAEQFAAFVDEGHSPREMVVLLGRMKNAGVFAQALRDEGLPCVISGGSVFSESLEAQVVCDLLRVLANPGQMQSLLNVLTSPLFALTAEDLLDAGGLSGFVRLVSGGEDEELEGAAQADGPAQDDDPTQAGDPALANDPTQPAAQRRLSERALCAVRVMRAAIASVRSDPPSRIVNRVLVDSGCLTRLERQGAEGMASAGNFYKGIRMVAGIEQSGVYGPATISERFIASLIELKEAPGALSVSGGDSVRIMTIHSSKGLEFPIVGLAETRESRAPRSKLLVAQLEGNVYVSLDLARSHGDKGSPVSSEQRNAIAENLLGTDLDEDDLARAVMQDAGPVHRRFALLDYMAVGDEEEGKRLLYVALTRAKEALVIVSDGSTSRSDQFGMPGYPLAGVFEALGFSAEEAAPARAVIDFGGHQPAIVECETITADDAEVRADEGCGRDADDGFAVPAAAEHEKFQEQPLKVLHQDTFSYSSIAEAAHEGDLLDRLADSFAVSCDGACDDSFVVSEQLPGDDRATDLGTAFHRLAQYAVLTRGEDGLLEMPPDERIEALSRTCNLDALQGERLLNALDRWFGSDVAQRMQRFADLRAEAPFFLSLPMDAGGAHAYLEGEIDLLAFDDESGQAFVVDYKTGGSCEETSEALYKKHVLQAACYAYAIMSQGVPEVTTDFVRVERGRADDPDQPQCVRFHFQADDMDDLARAIGEAYSLA